MAEQIIEPQLPGPNAPKYYYPGWFYYSPEPYHTTSIPKHPFHIPAPLKVAQHAVHDFTHPYGDSFPLPAPQTDVRETATAYHLDIELPGLRNKSDVRLKWTGGRTLYIEAAIKCQPLPEEALLSSANGSLAGKNKSEASDKNHSKEEKPVQFVKRERKTGEVARAFNFPVDVKQDETIAKLAYGVLTITVPKKDTEHMEEHKHVDIEHAGH